MFEMNYPGGLLRRDQGRDQAVVCDKVETGGEVRLLVRLLVFFTRTIAAVFTKTRNFILVDMNCFQAGRKHSR